MDVVARRTRGNSTSGAVVNGGAVGVAFRNGGVPNSDVAAVDARGIACARNTVLETGVTLTRFIKAEVRLFDTARRGASVSVNQIAIIAGLHSHQ